MTIKEWRMGFHQAVRRRQLPIYKKWQKGKHTGCSNYWTILQQQAMQG